MSRSSRALTALCVLVIPAAACAQEGPADVASQFPGNYELLSYETFPADGEAVDMGYIGRILYDAEGNMSAIGMPTNVPERQRATEENLKVGFAYWGRVTIDVEAGTVTHHVEGSPTRGSWPGQDLVRHFEWTDDGLLKLSLKNEEGRITGTLTWRKLSG